LLFREFQQIEIDADLINDAADKLVCTAAFGVVGRSDEVDSMLTEKLLGYVYLLLVLRVIDCY
jgi:hypothetical protein